MPIVHTEITLPRPINFEQAKPQLRQVVKKTAIDLASIMQQSMATTKRRNPKDENKSGRRRRRKARKEHLPSLPGFPPAPRTGTLRKSIMPKPESALFWKVQVGAAYGAFLESGTRKMSPRPFGDPAFQKIKPIFEQAVTQVFTNLEGVS